MQYGLGRCRECLLGSAWIGALVLPLCFRRAFCRYRGRSLGKGIRPLYKSFDLFSPRLALVRTAHSGLQYPDPNAPSSN